MGACLHFRFQIADFRLKNHHLVGNECQLYHVLGVQYGRDPHVYLTHEDHVIHGLPTEALAYDGGERGIRTLGPDFVGTHDFQSCPFSLSGISPFDLTLCA